MRCYAAAALEALLSFAGCAVSLFVPVFLHPVALVCFVTPYNTAGRRSQNPVVSSKMPCDATDGGTFKAALCLRRRYCYQSKQNGRAYYKCLHISLQTLISR